MKKKDFAIIGIIIFIAICFRLYKINSPLADKYSSQQADNATIARNFSRNEINLLNPSTNGISNIYSSIENTQESKFTNFPLYNTIFGTLYRYLPIPSITVEMYGRITTIFFSTIIIFVLYYISLKEHSRVAAFFSSFIYAVFPFYVFYSRVVLPETMALACMFLAILFMYLFIPKNKSSYVYFALSILLCGVAILVKPSAVFYTVALLYLFISKYKFDLFKHWEFYFYFILSFIPFFAWRFYVMQSPQGISDSSGLFGFIQTANGLQNIFFKPIFFTTLFKERIGVAIFGIYMSIFLVLGLIGNFKKNFHISVIISALLYLLVVQGGNIQFEYYQSIILPALALVSGIGIGHIANKSESYNKLLLIPAALLIFVLSFYFSYLTVKDYYNYRSNLTQVAKLITTFTQPDDKIVTDTNGDNTLLYLSDRKGSSSLNKEIPELKQVGYSYVITAKKELTDELKAQGFDVLVENQQFAIIKL